ncbi:hypothetical protein CLD25_11835, partial [Mycobacterium tuberculosis]|uniref:PE family protein n=1 Tax=Mycobacterium tuberculosis TaxID=1773 RepID=UPI000BC54CE0
MSFVIAAPEVMAAAATDLANIGSSISAASAAAAGPTMGILAAGADEVSVAISALFGSHAQGYQTLSAQLAAYHNQFVRALNAGAGSYASAEAANVQQTLLNAINAPTQTLLGRPLIGNGADGGPGQNGGPGGLLYGNGGNGGNVPSGAADGGAGGDARLIGNGGDGGSVGAAPTGIGNGGNGGNGGWLYGDGGSGGSTLQGFSDGGTGGNAGMFGDGGNGGFSFFDGNGGDGGTGGTLIGNGGDGGNSVQTDGFL